MGSKVFHKGKYYINFKRGFDDFKRCISISIDKVFESDGLRILLSDDEDPTFLCVLNVTHLDYEDLKKQQGLLIDFDNFPSQLVRLLQQCASNNMFLIMHLTNPVNFCFEIVEHNEFKRLVHLALKTGPATDSEIIQHMAESIVNLKKTLSSLKNSASSTEALLNDKCMNMERKIQDLSHILSKMEEDKLRRESEYQEGLKIEKERMNQERMQWQRNAEINFKSQLATTQETLNRKDKQIEETNTHCNHLRDNIMQLESQISEKIQRLNLLETEVQKSHIEVATLKAKNSTLEKDIMERDKQYSQLSTKCVQLEKKVKEQTEIIHELNNTLRVANKEKASLEERLSLSESLAAKNNEAAHGTSEQLLKANQIISKQNTDLMELKEKLLCRTSIALEQEKVIEKNTKEIEELKSEITTTNQIVNKLNTDLDNLREKYEHNEKALKDRDETIKNNNMVIEWLHKKVEGTNKPVMSCSTPHFLHRANNTGVSEGISDESINFYATSKLSNECEKSPQYEPVKSSKTGLDPKYLQPSDDNNMRSKSKDTMKPKSADLHVRKGKENKLVELPTVDYKEKKSSRSTTYRTTPVSAYFPHK